MVFAVGLLCGCPPSVPAVKPDRVVPAVKPDRVVEIVTGDRNVKLDHVELREVTVQRGDTAAGLLAERGWEANADALEVLRSVNPGTDVYDLQPGRGLKLPSYEDGARPKRFVVDEQQKRDLLAVIHRGEEVWRAQGSAARSRQPEAVVQACDAIAKALHEIGERLERRVLVTTTESLVVLMQEARRFAELVPALATSPASAADQATLVELAENLREQTGGFEDVHEDRARPAPPPPPPLAQRRVQGRSAAHLPRGVAEMPPMLAQHRVQVRTKKRRPGALPRVDDVSGYRIWYVLMIDFGHMGSGSPLGVLSPSHAELPPGRYAFWATEPGRNAPRLGVVKSFLVGKSSDVVELIVDEEGP